MDKRFFSIIIPIYNSERYLDECLQSIQKQTYPNFEVIMINDGSTDKSIEICKKYINDNRFKLINKKNTGVSSSRNIGLNHAHGDYILFIDSDDWCDCNYLKIIAAKIDKNDLLCFGYFKSYANKNEQVVISSKGNISDQILDANSIGGYLWNKVFKTEIINKHHMRFDESIHYCEDLVFVKEYVDKIKKVNYINIPLYYYRIRRTSVSSNFYCEKSTSILNALEILMTKYSNSKNESKKLAFDYIINYYKLKDYLNPVYKVNYKILGNEKQIIKNISRKEYIKFIIIKKAPRINFILQLIKAKIKKRNEYQ